MNDEKILDQIKQSANSCEVPESLKPENITDKLSDQKKKSTTKRIYQIGGLAAAAFALVIGISAMSGRHFGVITSPDGPTSGFVARETKEAAEEPAAEMAEVPADEVIVAENEDFSKVFTKANSYEDVLDTMDKFEEFTRNDAMKSELTTEEAPAAEMPAAEESMGDMKMRAADSGGTTDYSTTNLQVEGVDEGDIVKTDGKHIYVIKDNREIRIIKIDGANMKEVATVLIDNASGEERVFEMYLDNDKLNILSSGYGNGLREASEDTFYMDYRATTNIYTYDLSNPESPKLLGKVSQDGDYSTSRKVGDYIYLFTNFYPKYMGSLARSEQSNGYVDMVPYVGEKMIAPEDIYLPAEPWQCNYIVISSVNLEKPSEIVDHKAILEDARDYYVTTENIYIKKYNWYHETESTSIAKFSFKDGMIKGESAGIVPGSIADTFAINEYNDTLRVLTSVWNNSWQESENCVTVFDEKMNVTGKIRGLAKGEIIYSARFMGETGYFVTYRNMDPLFAVDFSDPHNPEILGELKITGFSEYLHFYGDKKLLGIGWETNPETGERLGMKLSMFDISDPANLKEIDKLVVKNVDAFPGEYDYKSLMVSPNKNIIGLTTSSWGANDTNYSYMVFSYEEGSGFTNQLSYVFAPGDQSSWEYDNSRGMYVDNTFYVVTYKNIYAFDMEQKYQKIGEFS